MTSSLRSCQPSVYQSKTGESCSVSFTTAQQVNLSVAFPHCPFDAKHQAGIREVVNTKFKAIVLTLLKTKPKSAASEADALIT